LCYAKQKRRHATLYTSKGILNLLNAKYETDDRPIDEDCGCPTCKNHSRAYIRHLFKAKEMLAMRLAVLHNLYFYNTLAEEIRNSIDDGTFNKYKDEKIEILQLRL
jgi:queuine tRNA-ribosyltransferase